MIVFEKGNWGIILLLAKIGLVCQIPVVLPGGSLILAFSLSSPVAEASVLKFFGHPNGCLLYKGIYFMSVNCLVLYHFLSFVILKYGSLRSLNISSTILLRGVYCRPAVIR